MRLGTCTCKSVEMDEKYGKFQRPHTQGATMCRCLNCGRTYLGTTTEYTEPKTEEQK